MSHQFFMKANDTSPDLQVTLKDGDDNAVDVTGATIVFSMAMGGLVKVSEHSATIVTASSGIVKYSWAAGNTDTPGTYRAEFEVTFSNGKIETFPNSAARKLEVLIEPEIA